MDIVFAHEEWDKDAPSIFLAGPSPRQKGDINWRPAALTILDVLGFTGGVFVPLPRDGEWKSSEKVSQWDWEDEYLQKAESIAFWIPRDLVRAPGFTTNIEFGEYMKSGKIAIGSPLHAKGMGYIRHRAEKLEIPTFHGLKDVLESAMKITNEKYVFLKELGQM